MAKIHFLNVGHGDCSIIEHNNGNITVIDINNGSDDMDDTSVEEIAESAAIFNPLVSYSKSLWQLNAINEETLLKRAGYNIPLTNPIEFLQEKYSGRKIFRYIQTHPDFDHLRGLASLKDNFEVLNFWDHPHSKEWDGEEMSAGDVDNWNAYEEFRQGLHCKVLHLHRGSKGKYWNEGDDGENGNGIHILSPTPAFRKTCDEIEDWNSMSYVIEYKTANRRIIFGGDAEHSAWENIFENYGAKRLKCDVLKASHHGRDTGYHQESVKAMNPAYTIVSVGKKPSTDASNKYRQYSSNVWSTRWKGNITLNVKNDGTMEWSFNQS